MPAHKDDFHGYLTGKATFDLRAGHSLPPNNKLLPVRHSRRFEFIVQHSLSLDHGELCSFDR